MNSSKADNKDEPFLVFFFFFFLLQVRCLEVKVGNIFLGKTKTNKKLKKPNLLVINFVLF